MKIKIILEDNGPMFSLKCTPSVPEMISQWKAGNRSPALVYAVHAINKWQNMAEAANKEQKENQLILPDSISKSMRGLV